MIYFNEFDKYPAQWLRNLYPDAVVDERSIADVQPDELSGYERVHLFAGIAGWEYALQLAGWPQGREIWSGSCPCQPFSVAGKGKGTADSRHLWPEMRRLIAERRPRTVFGEQVASRAGREWLSGVRADLEALGYAVGAADLCAASAGAPHIRQRLYWVADAGYGTEHSRRKLAGTTSADKGREEERERIWADIGDGGDSERVANAERNSRESRGAANESGEGPGASGTGPHAEPGRCSDPGGLGNTDYSGPQGRSEYAGKYANQLSPWTPSELIQCADGKTRRTQPGLFPLAYGFQSYLGDFCAIEERAWKEVVVYGTASERDPDEALRMVRDAIHSQASGQSKTTGVRQQLLTTPLLLDLVLSIEAARNRAPVGGCIPETGSQKTDRLVRSLRQRSGDLRPPHQWESARQQPSEPTDPVFAVSLILARHAEAYKQAVFGAHAALGRVGKLRAYGNAIVPPLAATFIRAFLECE